MVISTVAFAAILASATPSGQATQQDPPATLSFSSQTQVLDGYVYGLEAIDGRDLGYGQKVSTDVAAGHSTIQYSCPGESNAGSSVLTFEFLPGRKYELVCGFGEEAQIRPADC